jgi:segregation and condensation protein A
MICLFLAILEMVKRQALSLSQSDSFGDIDIRRGEAFDQAMEEVQETQEEYR